MKSSILFSNSDELSSELPCLCSSLLGLRRVSLSSLRGSENILFRLLFNGLELEDVTVQLSGVGANKGVAFSHLDNMISLK